LARELWTYIRCKQGTRERNKIADPDAGDAYCYFGIERNSKLILAWHLGRRNTWDAHDFIVKLSTATAGSFQLSRHPGFPGCPPSARKRPDFRSCNLSSGNVYTSRRDALARKAYRSGNTAVFRPVTID
jgi:hypothetical protein